MSPRGFSFRFRLQATFSHKKLDFLSKLRRRGRRFGLSDSSSPPFFLRQQLKINLILRANWPMINWIGAAKASSHHYCPSLKWGAEAGTKVESFTSRLRELDLELELLELGLGLGFRVCIEMCTFGRAHISA